MTQISRPFQIALAALVLFVAVWFVALRGHSSSGSSTESSAPAVSSASSSSPSSSAASATASTFSAGTSSSGSKAAQHKAHHAAAPAAGGLKHAIVKAQGAVKHSAHKASATKGASAKSAKPHAAAPAKASVGSANTQQAVEAELKRGSVVALLFWNPKGSVDGVVRRELHAVSHSSHGAVDVHVARANEIGSFGSFTRAVQVYSTPTILLINTKGKTSSLSGLIDAFGIEQAVREVKRAK